MYIARINYLGSFKLGFIKYLWICHRLLQQTKNAPQDNNIFWAIRTPGPCLQRVYINRNLFAVAPSSTSWHTKTSDPGVWRLPDPAGLKNTKLTFCLADSACFHLPIRLNTCTSMYNSAPETVLGIHFHKYFCFVAGGF